MSIVVAVTGVDETSLGNAPGWLAALLREARDVGAELLLAGDLTGQAASYRVWASAAGVPLHVLEAPATRLAPELWALGLAAARGALVAFTINQCTVEPGWARAAIGGLEGRVAGVGGRLALAPRASRTARAIYYLRYAAFLEAADARREVPNIAGDNAVYRRDVLLRYADTYGHGFWEVEAHHRMRADGQTLALVPGMSAAFGGAPRLGPFLRQRFAHGAHFGAWRVRAGGRRPWQIALAAPLVPLVLLVRAARAAARGGHGSARVAPVLGPFLALAAAWAAGEAAGAMRGRPSAAPHSDA